MWFNFHTHSNYCDGKDTLDAYTKQAGATGMVSLGFSSHAPLPFLCKWCMKADAVDSYLHEINQLQKNNPAIQLYAGLEVDYIPEIIRPDQFSSKLDYTIGSIHFVETFDDGKHWEIDGSYASFREGLAHIFKMDVKAAIIRYFELTREMILKSCPTVIGHLDKIKIQNTDNQLFNEQDDWYQYELKKTIDLIATTDAIIEVNTRGLYQNKSNTAYPSPWALAYICDKQIPITLSSDAHHPDDLTNRFSETASLLYTIGFKHLKVLYESQWNSYSFNEQGIIF